MAITAIAGSSLSNLLLQVLSASVHPGRFLLVRSQSSVSESRPALAMEHRCDYPPRHPTTPSREEPYRGTKGGDSLSRKRKLFPALLPPSLHTNRFDNVTNKAF